MNILKEKAVALADFLKINENDVKVVDEYDGTFEALDKEYLVTFLPLGDHEQTGSKYGFYIYEN